MLQICFCVYLVCPLERRNALAEALGGEDDLEVHSDNPSN